MQKRPQLCVQAGKWEVGRVRRKEGWRTTSIRGRRAAISPIYVHRYIASKWPDADCVDCE